MWSPIRRRTSRSGFHCLVNHSKLTTDRSVRRIRLVPARTAFEKRDPRDGCGGGITTTQVTQNVRPESCNLRSVHNVHHRIDRTRPQVTALGPSCDSGFASRPGPQGSCVNHPPRCVCWHVGYGHSKSKVLVTTITHMPAYGSSFGMLGTPSDDLMGSWESASSRFLRRRFDPANASVSRGVVPQRAKIPGRVPILGVILGAASGPILAVFAPSG